MSSSENALLQRDNAPKYKSFAKISLIVLNIALSSFYFGYTIVYFGQMKIRSVDEIFNNPEIDPDLSSGLLNGAVPLGALIGALSSSLFIARFSRRQCLLIVNVLAFVFGVGVFIPNYYLLAIMRIGQGFCVGFYSAIAPLIVKELAPKQISGTLGTFTQLNVTIGVVFGCFFRYILFKIDGDPNNKDTWFYLFGFTLITVALQTLILIFVFPYETPRYLLQKGKLEETVKLLEVIYKEQYIEEVLAELRKDVEATETKRDVTNSQTVLSDRVESPIKVSSITTIVAIHLAVLQQFSGINAIAVYGGNIASKSMKDLQDILPTLINLLQVLTTLVTSYLLSKFGRKAILQGGTFAAGIACALISVGFFIMPTSDDPDFVPTGAGPIIVVLGLFLFMAVFGLSLGPIVWLYIPEIVQPKIVPYSTAANWIGALIVIMFFPILSSSLTTAPLFIFFTAWCFCSFIFNHKFVVETKDKTEREIGEEYAEKKLC